MLFPFPRPSLMPLIQSNLFHSVTYLCVLAQCRAVMNTKMCRGAGCTGAKVNQPGRSRAKCYKVGRKFEMYLSRVIGLSKEDFSTRIYFYIEYTFLKRQLLPYNNLISKWYLYISFIEQSLIYVNVKNIPMTRLLTL